MIYFNDELKKKAEALHTDKDFADAFKDLSRIEYTINHTFTQADLEKAKKLDDELYRKYPEITIMPTIANAMPKVTLHSLRHTNITLQLVAGVDTKTVPARAGHSKVSTTSDFYSHFIKNSDIHASEILNKIFE